jgi:hypothetical protein
LNRSIVDAATWPAFAAEYTLVECSRVPALSTEMFTTGAWV